MALPKINEVPKYTTTIPSTGKKVTYRPFLVKEQKILLIAMESQDDKLIVQAIADTITACIDENINVKNLATFDVEYLFTQIRSKSVGETSTVKIKCKSCEDFSDVQINLDEIGVEIDKTTKRIELTDRYVLNMKYPSYDNMIDVSKAVDDSFAMTIYSLVQKCLDTLQTEEDLIKFEDETKESIEEFIDSLNNDQYEKLVAYVLRLPKLKHDVEFDCEHCGHHNKVTLQGIQDFF